MALILDEPAAALDAETEHALFERYAAAARIQRQDGSFDDTWKGQITILISHRFSTVRMADQIVMLDGSRVAEVGTHEALMAEADSTLSYTESKPRRTADLTLRLRTAFLTAPTRRLSVATFLNRTLHSVAKWD